MSFACTSNDKKHITVKSNRVYRIIPITDIIYIESVGRKVKIYTTHDIVESYQKISALEEMLNETFYRCHRCYIVNIQYIEGYNTKYVKLKNRNGTEIPLSREKITEFKNTLNI